MNITGKGKNEDEERRIERRIRRELVSSERIRIRMICSVCGKRIGVVRLPASVKDLPEEITGDNVIVHCSECTVLYNPDNLLYSAPNSEVVCEDEQPRLAERYWKEGQSPN